MRASSSPSSPSSEQTAIEGLCDEGSVLELRDGFGAGMVTALARVEGKALGVIANDPAHLGGAIDADAAYGEIDDVIDPADSRRWIATLFDPPTQGWRERSDKLRANVDAW